MPLYLKLKILLGVALALIISIFGYTYLNSLADEVKVIVAAQDIEVRTIIKPEMVREVSVRKSDRQVLAANTFQSLEEMQTAVSNVKILSGKPIDKNQDVIWGTKESLIDKKVLLSDGSINNEYFVPDNKRIITVRVDSQGAVMNSLNKGDYVDILCTMSAEQQKTFTTPILQHIEVFEVEPVKDNGEQNISLVVTPQQMVDVAFAKRTGKIDLALTPLKGQTEILTPASIGKFIR